MESGADHYAVLGLPSGEEGAKLSLQDINKGYRYKARELHPDKRPDDPKAHDNFQKLQASYEILKDDKARKLFDDGLRVKREKFKRQDQLDSKRQKMMSDLERREQQSSSRVDPQADIEMETIKKFREEVARIRAMAKASKMPAATTPPLKTETPKESFHGSDLDKERVLKVSWEKMGRDYTIQELREIFEQFGQVEDVIRSSKKRGLALVVMKSKDAVDAAVGNVLGDLSNPLLVKPLIVVTTNAETTGGSALDNLLDAAKFQAYENSVMEKL
ncbi:hypothetical protein M569_08760, partial [Genlisea aurea]